MECFPRRLSTGLCSSAQNELHPNTCKQKNMPKKKKKGKGMKGGGKKAKKGKGTLTEKEDMVKKTRDLHKQYLVNCTSMESSPGAAIVTSLTQCLEEEKPLTKVGKG